MKPQLKKIMGRDTINYYNNKWYNGEEKIRDKQRDIKIKKLFKTP